MANDKTIGTPPPAPQVTSSAKPSVTEQFQAELNALMAKYPTIKLVVNQTITITEKQ